METDMDMNASISTLKGIGPKKAKALENLHISCIEELVFNFPKRYEDRRNVKNIDSLLDGEKAVVTAKILLIVKGKYRYGKKQTLKLLVEDETGAIEIVFFNARYLERIIKKDELYVFYGVVSEKNGKLSMIHPEMEKPETQEKEGILPVYHLSKGVSQKELRKWQTQVSPLYETDIEYLTGATLKRNNLCSLSYALKNIHFPEDGQKLKEAKFRLVFDEFLLLQTGLLTLRARNEWEKQGITFCEEFSIEEFIKSFPFEFTAGQSRVLNEIFSDMEISNTMHRLVQGDVGSGKTAIATCAMYKAVKNGYQAVIMAPTEILARQHFEGLKAQFEVFDINVGFLSGSLSAKDKREALEGISSGKFNVVVGTHAVIQPTVVFQNLGLVITDEQHRFGVLQRAKLSEKGDNPDILVMTATPIPRTLAVILYGDLDISYINEMPPGRQKIITKAIGEDKRGSAYEFLEKEINKGRQAYIVAPLIDDSENIDARSTTALYDEISNKFKQFQVGLIHGALKQREKDKLMESFHSGEIQILVSTVVIEVGINVPNASLMIIENAERFGLAQLHQLRGRVGRGKEQSYCILVTNENMEVAKERAETMTSTNDGFLIAEKDLQLRGPGEFFGIKQHGLPELKLADFSKHVEILFKSKNEVKLLLSQDPLLLKKENRLLKDKLERMFSVDKTNL